MAAPTFVAEYEVASWGTSGNQKTVTPTTASGDLLVVLGGAEGAELTLTPSGNSLTYTLRQSILVTDFCAAYAWTAPATAATGWTLAVDKDGNNLVWGITALRFSGGTGIGASSKTNTSGAPSLSITTTQANSALAVLVADWNAIDGATRTWRTVNGTAPTAGNGFERVYFRNSSFYTVYAAYYPDAGAAGAKTVGLSAPAGQKYSIVAVEILGTADAETGETAGSASVALGITATAVKHAGAAAPLTLGLATADDVDKAGVTAGELDAAVDIDAAASKAAAVAGSASLSISAVTAAQKQALTAAALDLALAIAGAAQAAGEGTTAAGVGLGLGLSATATKSALADATMAVSLAILGTAEANAGATAFGALGVQLATLADATKHAVAAAHLSLGLDADASTVKQAAADALLGLAIAVAGMTGDVTIPTGSHTMASLTPAGTVADQTVVRLLRSTTTTRSLAALED